MIRLASAAMLVAATFITLGRSRLAPLPSHVGEDTPSRGFVHDPVIDTVSVCFSHFSSAFLEAFL